MRHRALHVAAQGWATPHVTFCIALSSLPSPVLYVTVRCTYSQVCGFKARWNPAGSSTHAMAGVGPGSPYIKFHPGNNILAIISWQCGQEQSLSLNRKDDPISIYRSPWPMTQQCVPSASCMYSNIGIKSLWISSVNYLSAAIIYYSSLDKYVLVIIYRYRICSYTAVCGRSYNMVIY